MTIKFHAFLVLAIAAATPLVFADELEADFRNPPDTARPGVYWYFLDGNQDRKEMVADLHAMKDAGIGSILFLEVDLGIPRGPVPFMSEPWQDNIANAFVEAGKLGMEVMLGTGPGWAGSGGSWVGIEDSMQHLVGSSVKVSGPAVLNQILPVPPPHPANHFAGMAPQHVAQRDKWFRDVAVLAFPTPASEAATIDEVDIKTLKDVKPYSIRRTQQRYIMPHASFDEPDVSQVFDEGRVVDLTPLLKPDGSITWDIPAGDWTIMRFVARGTGQTSRPAPQSGHGFENNKFDADSYRRHWEHYQKKLLDRVIKQGGPLQPGRGVTTIHLDSWEMSSQNWTADFREEFQKRRGYDPQPFYPAWMGMVVGSREKTERFLWDMRKTSQELVLEEHAGAIRQLAHQNGLLYSNEPYDMNPAGNIDLGSLADIPMCEFWSNRVDTQYSCVEAVSIARTMGPQIVKAESFTTFGRFFSETPANMKNQTDWALAMGINGFMFHTYEHQPLGEKGSPGFTLGPYGIHWNRNQTLWNFLNPYHGYLTRCSHLLRQGEAVADILYLTPEGAPFIFEAPADAFEGDAGMRDKNGHVFDAVTPRILKMRAVVEDGRVAFPDGSKYRVLVLPDVPTMTPETLAKIEELVKAGATVIGKPPVKSPSLVNFPACDEEVSTRAAGMWRGTRPPASVTRIDHGSGAIFWGGELAATTDLYPTYQATAALLADLGLAEDFSSPSGKLRFQHRQTDDRDIYFVSNRSGEQVVTEGVFRIDGLRPQLWDPVTGETRTLDQYQHDRGMTRVPLFFEPFQSIFVIFPHHTAGGAPPAAATGNFPGLVEVAQLSGAWNLAFDPARGGPAKTTFESLIDWATHPEEGIRYYSGTATYRKTFDVKDFDPSAHAKTWLDLGVVRDICRVRLNGKDLGIVWTAPWRVETTGVVRSTGNQLEIEVANTWVNRLIGDQQPANKGARTLSWPSGLLDGKEHPAGRYSFITHNDFKANTPLRPAGLLGPVSVRVNGAVTGTSFSVGNADALAGSFRNPSEETMPWCYWYWLNGDVSKEGITKDLEAMAKIGIKLAMIGNIHGQGGTNGPVRMLTPEWYDLTRHAFREANRLSVDLMMFNAPGWSQSGGPWIKPEQSMRRVAWSEFPAQGGEFFQKVRPANLPPSQDIAVLAVPRLPVVSIDGAPAAGAVLRFSHAVPFTARSLIVHGKGSGKLYALRDGERQFIADIEAAGGNAKTDFLPGGVETFSFKEVTAREFELVPGFKCRVELSSAPTVAQVIEKQLGRMHPTPSPTWDSYIFTDTVEPDDTAPVVKQTRILNLTDKLGANGVLNCTLPQGDWTIIHFGMVTTGRKNAPAPPEATGLEVDKMSKTHIRHHFKSSIGPLLERMSPEERAAFKGITIDSYEVGSQNWTDGFAAEFEKRNGYNPIPLLPVMTGRMVDGAKVSDRFLWDLRRTVADMIGENYVGGLREIARQNGLAVWCENYGHWGFPAEFTIYGGYSEMIGGEFWTTGNLGTIECRAASSTGHIYGKQKIYAEAFTSRLNLGSHPAAIKARGEEMFCEGVNHFVLHVYAHQARDGVPGMNPWFGTAFHRNTPWFTQSRDWVKYLQRCHTMLQQGEPVADVAVYIGDFAPQMTGPANPVPAGYDYDFMGSDAILRKLHVVDGEWVVYDEHDPKRISARWKVLAMPELKYVRPKVLKRLDELKAMGGRVLDGVPLAEAALKDAGIVPLVADASCPLRWKARKLDDGMMFFLSNFGKTGKFEATLRVTGKLPELFDPVTGEIRKLARYRSVGGGTRITLDIKDRSDSCFLVFREKPSTPSVVRAQLAGQDVSPAELRLFHGQDTVLNAQTAKAGSYMLTFSDGTTRSLLVDHESQTLTVKGPWQSTKQDEKGYSVLQETAFELPAAFGKGQRVILDLGQVQVMAKVRLNDKVYDTLWRPPFTLDVTDALNAGKNTLKVLVTSTSVGQPQLGNPVQLRTVAQKTVD